MLRAILLLLVATPTVLTALGQSPTLPAELQNAMAELDKVTFRAHMTFLADDLLEGRGTGKRGHEIAARYLAAQFSALGLQPGGDDVTFYQRVPLRETLAQPEGCAAQIRRNGAVFPLLWGRDFVMLGSAGEANAFLDAPIIFVGYGITTPDGRHDDYAGLDVKDKIVAFLYGAPPSLPSELGAHFTSREEKMKTARAHGAAGIMVLWTPRIEKIYPWRAYVDYASSPTMNWLGPDGSISGQTPGLKIYATLSQPVAEALFSNAPKRWKDVLTSVNDPDFHGFSLPVTATLRFAGRQTVISSPNVVAILPGSDPDLSHQYVVYSAHLDHLGIGTPVQGDSIYNGALDNASGAAAMLMIARAFQSLPHRPARSILFLGTTAEEQGMLGSDYFAHFPTVPAQSLVADLNIDGASLLYGFRDVVAYGGPDSSLGEIAERAATRLGLKVSPDPAPDEIMFIRSDQYSFVRRGIPSLYVTEGDEATDPKIDAKKLVAQWEATRYHRPSDDMQQPLDFDAVAPFMRVQFLIGYEVAQTRERPQWKPGDFFGETFANRRHEEAGQQKDPLR